MSVLADPVKRRGKQICHSHKKKPAAEPEIKLRVLEFNKIIFLMSFATKQDTCATTQLVLLYFLK